VQADAIWSGSKGIGDLAELLARKFSDLAAAHEMLGRVLRLKPAEVGLVQLPNSKLRG
jgi:hypothetical protein